MAGLSGAIDLDGIAVGLPRRIHEVTADHAADAPGRIALVEGGVGWSYRDLDRRVSETAAVLSSLGVRAGDRMIIVSENCISLAALLLAASRIDAWAIVANPRLSARELDQIRDHSGARRMFFASDVSKEAAVHASRLGAENRQLGPLPNIGVGPLNENATVEPVEADPAKQVAVLIYTSGTTGTPKGVMLSHDNLLISARTTAHFRKMDRDDKIYLVLPISHIVGISLLIMTLMVGGTARMVSKFDPAATAKALAEEGITILNGVPATYQRLLEYKSVSGLHRLDPGSLRLIAVAGAPLDLNLKSRVEQELGLPLLNGYGITECSPGISGVRFDAPRADQAVGTLLPGVEGRIGTLDGRPASKEEVGELYVRGRNVMRGYYRAPELTAKVIDSEGWFNTGDLVRFDGDCLYIVGRTKEHDHPLGLQRLPRRGRSGPQFAQGRRAMRGGRPCRRRQRRYRGFCAIAAGGAGDAGGSHELRPDPAHLLQAAVRNHRSRRLAGDVYGQDTQAQARGVLARGGRSPSGADRPASHTTDLT
ncbi:long-chain acyl-CoA synthetase [Bradyrhizobium sp. LB9.1b]